MGKLPAPLAYLLYFEDSNIEPEQIIVPEGQRERNDEYLMEQASKLAEENDLTPDDRIWILPMWPENEHRVQTQVVKVTQVSVARA